MYNDIILGLVALPVVIIGIKFWQLLMAVIFALRQFFGGINKDNGLMLEPTE